MNSIIKQLRNNDELIISYNESKDSTLDIISEYAAKYSFIHVLYNPEPGIISNFDNAIINCSGDIIILSDQDDVWMEDKVERIREAFQNNAKLVLYEHNCCETDENLVPSGADLFMLRNCRRGFLKNLLRNGYQGCCMAFRNEMTQYICPIPRNIAMHDQWIGLICEKHGDILFDNVKLIFYRRHGENSSTDHIKVSLKIKYIAVMLKEFANRNKRRG